LKELHQLMTPLIRKTSPFEKIPKTNGAATGISPELVAEIKYTEQTKDEIFRHPVFLHLREDKSAEDLKPIVSEKMDPKPTLKPKIVKEKKDIQKKIGKQKVKVTYQNKIYFPKDELTKGDVVAYYQSVANYILPHLKDRPQSMNRFPNGIDGMSFYQKDAADETPDWVETQEIFSESNEKNISYIL